MLKYKNSMKKIRLNLELLLSKNPLMRRLLNNGINTSLTNSMFSRMVRNTTSLRTYVMLSTMDSQRATLTKFSRPSLLMSSGTLKHQSPTTDVFFLRTSIIQLVQFLMRTSSNFANTTSTYMKETQNRIWSLTFLDSEGTECFVCLLFKL